MFPLSSRAKLNRFSPSAAPDARQVRKCLAPLRTALTRKFWQISM